MAKTRKVELNFASLAADAAVCAAQWLGWREQHKSEPYMMEQATKLAGLFNQQSQVLMAMHRNRIEWHKVKRNEFTGNSL